MEQLEKIERNRKLPLRPQEVESTCSNMDMVFKEMQQSLPITERRINLSHC